MFVVAGIWVEGLCVHWIQLQRVALLGTYLRPKEQLNNILVGNKRHKTRYLQCKNSVFLQEHPLSVQQ